MKLSSVKNAVKLATFKRPLSLEKPTVIQFPVIDVCNSKCQMCRIWENKKSKDITLEELEVGLDNELFSEVRGVGINGGEPTLRQDLPEVIALLIKKLPKLTGISLITNGFKVEQVTSQIQQIGELLKEHNLHFDVMVSLDGVDDVHDRVRGRSGNFKNACKVLEFLKSTPLVNNLRVGCTVIKENVYELAPLLEFCIKNDIYIKYRLGVQHQRLYTENLLDPYSLSFEEKYELVEFLEGLITHYETSNEQIEFYRSLIGQIIKKAPRTAGCDWQHRGCTITAKGELAYCAVKSKPLMKNISIGDAETAYFGNKNHLKDIIDNECANCNHDYVGIPDRTHYIKGIIKRIDKFDLLSSTLVQRPLSKLRGRLFFNKSLTTHRRSTEKSHIKFENGTKVLICGWYGTETLGDKAIIGGIMHAFRQKFGENTQFAIVALHEYISKMTQKQMPEFRNAHIINTMEAVNLCKDMNYVVFGGGPIMGINELAPMQVIFEKAKEHHVKSIICGSGLGPFGEKWHNDSIKRILELSDVRFYRDEKSKKIAKELGIDTQKDKVVEDPAFTWLDTIRDYIPPKKTNSNKVLLLGLRDFPYHEYARHLPVSEALAIRDNYEKVIVKALSRIVTEIPNIVIRPLPMCTNHFGADDRWFYRKLFREHTHILNNLDDSLLGKELSPIDYCRSFVTADSLLAMRFHSLVFGLGLGINSVALDYTLGKGKVRSLAERFNVPLNSMLDLDEESLAKNIIQSLSAAEVAPIDSSKLSFLKTFMDSEI
ncbi:polysaccharide pyruvyl transferase family protein [Vibrio hyugaensis]|uniref:polysaccharide pyruvyl transferase family protein n=1 Tax=Vibrio hyugaensis TaxID=1534743 RepID=UPI0005F0848C|nr:polysaccharide pyruvyl transferase family protein [Vibrio hyugaensis]